MPNSTIPVKVINFHRVEGRTDECAPKTFTTWEALRAHVKLAALTAPDDGSYDKCDVVVTWEDGASWYMRFDMERKHRFDGGVATEMFADVTFWSGLHRPAHMNEETYTRFINGTGENVKAMAKQIASDHDFGTSS